VPYELAVQCSAVDHAVDYVLKGKYLESWFLVEGNIFFYLRISKKAKRRNNQN